MRCADRPTARPRGAVLLLLLPLLAALAGARPAAASELVDRDVATPRLAVGPGGTALVTYRKGGRAVRVLYWGARNASPRFRRDRSGGWKSGRGSWRRFRNVCRPYRGPRLPWAVAACTAPDGSHWALQAWRRIVPNGGGAMHDGPVELRLSHWTGPLGVLRVRTDWSWRGQFHHVYGQLTYRGRPVGPEATTSTGYVLDRRGRNVFLDAYASDLGDGWRRVNGILANNPRGQFCYGLTPKSGPYGFVGTGRSRVNRYRASTTGPGVTPDIVVAVAGPPPYDPAVDAVANAEQATMAVGAGACARPS